MQKAIFATMAMMALAGAHVVYAQEAVSEVPGIPPSEMTRWQCVQYDHQLYRVHEVTSLPRGPDEYCLMWRSEDLAKNILCYRSKAWNISCVPNQK